jgi:hypothetical protein
VKAGHLFIVPRFFVVSKICDPDGMSWFSIITTPKWVLLLYIYSSVTLPYLCMFLAFCKDITTPCMITCSPIFTHLAGRTSVWKALSPQVLEASLKVSPDVEQLFRSKRVNEEIFFPPPKWGIIASFSPLPNKNLQSSLLQYQWI